MTGSPFIPYNSNDDSYKMSLPDKASIPDKKSKDGLLYYSDITYVGGHKAHPTSADTCIYIYNDRIEIGVSEEDTELSIPYANMIGIENADKDKISAFRVVMFGVIGALWKKKAIYTVIQYRDEMDEQTIVLDFGNDIDKLQPFIYRKMLEFRKK